MRTQCYYSDNKLLLLLLLFLTQKLSLSTCFSPLPLTFPLILIILFHLGSSISLLKIFQLTHLPYKHRIILKPQVWPHISPTYHLHWLSVTDPSKPKLFSKIYKTNSCPGPYLWLLLHHLLHPSLYFTLKHTTPLQKLFLLPVMLISYPHDKPS